MKLKLPLPRMGLWTGLFWLITVLALYVTYLRVMYGLGGSTNLRDSFPWGLWVGFDVLCGVGLAAGGFTLAAIVHIFNIERYKPILRPAILTAFLGYLLVIVALMFDLGRPYRIWHPLIMWNPRSVMFEVGWCVTLYTSVLALEFAPIVLERFGFTRLIRWLRAALIPTVIAAVILSTLHQSSLGSLYLIVPGKLHPLWYTPLLPLLFFVSAICVGFAMTIFESWHSSKAFGRQLELPLLASLGRNLAIGLLFYLVIRVVDLLRRGVGGTALQNTREAQLFWLECLLMLVPMVLLFLRQTRTQAHRLYISAVLVILGFVTHRLNVSVTGMEWGAGETYVPRWTEVVITLWIISLGFAIFHFVAQRFPVFGPHAQSARS